jgi:hypothetical protein
MRSWRASLFTLALALAPLVARAGGPAVKVYKSPTCGCCNAWIDHLEDHGFAVEATNLADVSPVKRANGVPRELDSCHTALVGGYVVEGHVPAADVKRLLADSPPVLGIAVPDMPTGSPGMEGPDPEPYRVLSFDKDGRVEVFATHEP